MDISSANRFPVCSEIRIDSALVAKREFGTYVYAILQSVEDRRVSGFVVQRGTDHPSYEISPRVGARDAFRWPQSAFPPVC